jgi:hypothetical protein
MKKSAGPKPRESGMHGHVCGQSIDLANWLKSLGRLGCLSVIRLLQSFACQRSLVEVRPAIPVCILVGSVGLCVRAGLCGASDPWRSSAAIRILLGLMMVQTSLVPSRKYALRIVRFPVNNPATIKLSHPKDGRSEHSPRIDRGRTESIGPCYQGTRLHDRASAKMV